MTLAHAFAMAGLGARRTDRRVSAATEAEIREAQQRVVERRAGLVAASASRRYTERGRHAAPRPV